MCRYLAPRRQYRSRVSLGSGKAALAVALLASFVTGCSAGGSRPHAAATPTPTASPTRSAPAQSPWFLGNWYHHGVDLKVVPGGASAPGGFIADLSFRTYRSCTRKVTTACDRNVGRHGYVVGGLIRFELDANGVGSVIYSNDATHPPMARGDALVLYPGQHRDTLLIEDVTHPLSSFAELVYCGPNSGLVRSCGA